MLALSGGRSNILSFLLNEKSPPYRVAIAQLAEPPEEPQTLLDCAYLPSVRGRRCTPGRRVRSHIIRSIGEPLERFFHGQLHIFAF